MHCLDEMCMKVAKTCWWHAALLVQIWAQGWRGHERMGSWSCVIVPLWHCDSHAIWCRLVVRDTTISMCHRLVITNIFSCRFSITVRTVLRVYLEQHKINACVITLQHWSKSGGSLTGSRWTHAWAIWAVPFGRVNRSAIQKLMTSFEGYIQIIACTILPMLDTHQEPGPYFLQWLHSYYLWNL